MSDKPKRKLLILGGGGFGQALVEVAEMTREWSDIYFVDDKWPSIQVINGYKVISDIKNLFNLDNISYCAIAAVGSNTLRKEWHQQLIKIGIELATIIHPQSIISHSADIGKGCVVMAGCILSANVVIHEGVLLNIGTLLDHDVVVEEYSHLSVGISVAGGKVIEKYTFLDF